jgi:hypothetical protein
MPEISRFLGIIIAMFYRDHAPPHFHAIYGEYDITVEIDSGVINGLFQSERSDLSSSGLNSIKMNYWTIGNSQRKRNL